jgi:hypothetical protein
MTEEFFRLVNQSTKLSWQIAGDLRTVLQSSDQAKCAGEIFSQDFHLSFCSGSATHSRSKKNRYPIHLQTMTTFSCYGNEFLWLLLLLPLVIYLGRRKKMSGSFFPPY